MIMACPCCTGTGKLNTLDSNVVDLHITKGKLECSAASRRTKVATENQLSTKFEFCKPRYTSTHRKDPSSLSSQSHCNGLSGIKFLQQQDSNESSHCSSISSQHKVSARPKSCERKTLAFVLREEDASEAAIDAKSSCKNSVIFKNKPELTDREVSNLHPNLSLCREDTPAKVKDKHLRMHVGISSLHDYLVDNRQNDHDESDESEHEMKNAICLSSFTFGSKSQSLPLFESHTSGKKALVRQLSSESCISMLSLDCTDDHLTASGCIEPFSSADLCQQEEMTKFSVCFPETRNIVGDDVTAIEPYFEFGVSRRPCIQPIPNLGMEREKIMSGNIDLSPRKKTLKDQKVVPNLRKDIYACAKTKKRATSAVHERHKIGNKRTKKDFLNLRRCRRTAGQSGTDLMKSGFNAGIGIGVSYMLFANWQEFRKLNNMLEKTQALVQEMQQQVQSKSCPLLGCFSTLRTQASKNLQMRKDEQNENFKHADFKGKGAVEPMLRSINMKDLEAALEAELVLMQQNLEGSECQASQSDVDEWNPKEYSSFIGNLSRRPDHEEGSQHSSTKDYVLNGYHAVSPNDLNRRLHEVLEAQQEQKISHLEAQIEAREIELMMKEKELECWKDIAHHLVKSYRDKTEQTKTQSAMNERIMFFDDYEYKAPHNSFSMTKEVRKPSSVDYLHQQYEDSKSMDSVAATSCISGEVCNNQLPVRPVFLSNDISSALIDPSFEALISRNTFDWPFEDPQTHSTVSAWKEESEFSVTSDIARKSRNEAWVDQDVCDVLKGLDAERMFPWLLYEEECSAKFPCMGESNENSSLQINKDHYQKTTAKW